MLSNVDGNGAATRELRAPVMLRTRGRQIKLLLTGSATTMAPSEPDKSLVRALIRAHRWFELLKTGRANSIAAIASEERLTGAYVTRILRLAFLSPRLIESILEGTHPPELTVDRLTLRTEMPLTWREQSEVGM